MTLKFFSVGPGCNVAHSVLSPLSSKTSELVEVPEEADGPGDASDIRTRSNSGEWETVLQKPEHACDQGLQGAVSTPLRLLSPSESSGI